jgi:hypothetical protein
MNRAVLSSRRLNNSLAMSVQRHTKALLGSIFYSTPCRLHAGFALGQGMREDLLPSGMSAWDEDQGMHE